LFSACGKDATPASPTPTGEVRTANVYILPGAVDLGPNAFGDHPIIIYTGERMRWRNVDATDHDLVPDSAALPEFMRTGVLSPGSERSFTMATLGTTTFHCTIHSQMTGTLIVREQ
jgi:plastocyanin